MEGLAGTAAKSTTVEGEGELAPASFTALVQYATFCPEVILVPVV